MSTSARPPTANIVAIAAPANPPTTCAAFGDAALGQELAGGEREELAFARRDGGAEQADPQREVERERRRAGNPGADDAAQHDLGQRQQHDAAEGERRERVFGASARLAAHLLLGSCGRRLALERPRRRRRPAPSLPRIVFTKASASARKLAAVLGSSVVTVRPRVFIVAIESASSFGASPSSRFSAFLAAAMHDRPIVRPRSCSRPRW